MEMRRIKTPTGFYRDELPEAPVLVKLLMVLVSFLMGSLAMLCATVYFQARLLLLPVALMVGEIPVLCCAVVFGGVAGVVLFAASMVELREAMKATELKDRRARAEIEMDRPRHPRLKFL